MARNKTRWLVVYCHPATGREKLGTFPDGQTFAYYVSVENVIRYQLQHDHYPAGQYHIYHWPEGGNCSTHCVTAYKRARV